MSSTTVLDDRLRASSAPTGVVAARKAASIGSASLRKQRVLPHRRHAALLSTTAITAAACVALLRADIAAAQEAAVPQDNAIVDVNTAPGTSFVHRGADYTDREFDSPVSGGDANGWIVTQNVDTRINASLDAPLITVTSIGGSASQGGMGGGGEGADGGAGGSSGRIDYTIKPPLVDGSASALFQQSGAAGASVISIATIGGNGGSGQTPSDTTGAGGLGGAPGAAGDIVFNAYQGIGAPSAYSVIYAPSGTTAINLYSRGGAGGQGGETTGAFDATGVMGTAGAQGGNITADVALNMVDSGARAISATSVGGNGGDGGEGVSQYAKGTGGAGAQAGNGGDVSVDQHGGSIGLVGSGQASEIAVDIPNDPDPSHPQSANVSIETVDAALLAQSSGGVGGTDGGAGGFAGSGGHGGAAGDGGKAVIHLSGAGLWQDSGYDQFRDAGAIHTSGDNAVAIVASSVGGSGGGTQDVGGAFAKHGGGGGAGGSGGEAYVSLSQSESNDPSNDYTLITTNGTQSDAVIVQSIGGGGGIGGDVHGGGVLFTVQHGGKGGAGGIGGSAGIDNGSATVKGYQIHTKGANSFGVLVESIGGSGGRGGNADGIAAGVGALVVGGRGGGGGNAADATIANFGIIQTEGDQSIGGLAQSIGGGGGAGGSALAIDIGSVLTSATAIGGSGGVGGDGDLARIFNLGQVSTVGANAIGLVAQSVGGGGGNAGSSLAEAFAINPPDAPIPSFTLDLAIGGTGGAGGVGGEVDLYNTHLIATQGANAFGVLAQSIGGGGGNGGDATAMSQAYIQSNLTANVALGGNSGNGSVGGTVTARNSGLISTLGFGGIGVLAQSVGGGGGTGGFGQTNQGAYQQADGFSAESSVAIGGKGGKGGDGGDVYVTNYLDAAHDFSYNGTPDGAKFGNGGIVTGGVSAAGMLAQSIGGGGGNAGDGIGKGSGGKITVHVAIGGSGGAGGDGGIVVVDNGEGAILTAGANSPGIFAQSIGGGGGNGGNATTGSGNDPTEYYPEWLANQGADAVGNDTVTQINEGFWDWKGPVTNGYAGIDKLKTLYDKYQQSNNEVAPQPESNGGQDAEIHIDIGAGRAGAGGAAGDGGDIYASSAGTITTLGAGSYGMFGQSVGGGGGTAGGATAATTTDKPEKGTFAAAIGLGAANGASGSGGNISLTSSTGATIATSGDLSHGMYGLSVGGGGGVGGASTAVGAKLSGLAIELGADSSSGGKGGDVALDNDGTITTAGDDGYGMLGQSIGGGGGFASITGQGFDSTTGIARSESQVLGSHVDVRLSNPGAGSDGGIVSINLHGSGLITTSGINSYGIMAQSIGGSGGIAIIDPVTDVAPGCYVYNACDNQHVDQNDGGAVSVTTDVGSAIVTTGAGAAGIFAQTIGGGGMVINGLRGVNLLTTDSGHPVPSRGDSDSNWNAGNAGSIVVQANGNITTTGDYAHGIFAQAAQNGGGIIGAENGYGYLFTGLARDNVSTNCSGPLCSGHITINVGDGVNSSKIQVSGASAAGVAGFSLFGIEHGNSVHVVVNKNAQVIGTGQAIAAVLIAGQGEAIVDNYGLIDGSNSQNQVAIMGLTGFAVEYPYIINNSGTIRGRITGGYTLNESGTVSPATVNNMAGGVIEAGAELNLGSGTLTNAGTIEIGSTGTIAKTTLTGNYVGIGSGRLVVDTDHVAGTGDLLTVTGKATIAGEVEVRPSRISNKPVTVLTATGGITLDPMLATIDGSQLFDFTPKASADGRSVIVQPIARFIAAASSLGQNQQAVAGHLQGLFDGGASLDAGFAALGRLGSADQAAAAFDTLGGHALGAIGAFRYISSRAFVGNLATGCTPHDAGETSCAWARARVIDATQDSTSDELGYKAEAQAYQLGVQKEIGQNLYLAAAAAYEHGKFRDDERTARIKGDVLLAGMSLKYAPGTWELTGAFDGSYGWYASRRTIGLAGLSDVAAAKPKAWQLGAHVAAAYRLDLGGAAYLKPFAEVHGMYVHADAFAETGPSPFDLVVESQGDFAVTGAAGAELGGRIALGSGAALRPFVSAALEVNGATDWTTTARFVGQNSARPFSVTTAAPDLLGRFAFGLDLVTTGNLEISASYNPEIGKDFHVQAGTARLTWRF